MYGASVPSTIQVGLVYVRDVRPNSLLLQLPWGQWEWTPKQVTCDVTSEIDADADYGDQGILVVTYEYAQRKGWLGSCLKVQEVV